MVPFLGLLLEDEKVHDKNYFLEIALDFGSDRGPSKSGSAEGCGQECGQEVTCSEAEIESNEVQSES